LISVSEFTARQIDEVLGAHAPVVVAPHGVDLDRFTCDGAHDASLLGELGLPYETRFVLFVGTLEPRKGLDVLLESFEEVSAQDPSIELWIAGQAGWGVPELDEQLSRSPARPRVRRLGYVPDQVLPALMRRSRAVVYPSRGEGFGLPVLEAMACGAVVVTTRDTVMHEVAHDGALLATVGDSGSLTERIDEALVMHDDARATLASRARARAELFTWDVSLERHRSAYDLARKVTQ
jgi:glycosyltransferase involved in cell wall biosynthesis